MDQEGVVWVDPGTNFNVREVSRTGAYELHSWEREMQTMV